MEFEKTSSRIWRHLTREERLEAATAFWAEPSGEVLGAALALIVKTRHVRPQVARSLPDPAKVQVLATALDPGESLAAALLVALHLAKRRTLLVSFLDGVGIPHENGLIQDNDPAGPLPEERVRAGIEALKAFPPEQVFLYLNVLWLQDPERWEGLPRFAAALPGPL
ncbi:MAG TPA: hypothetical protein VN083_06705 [Vicinamibacteria bacterium]|nr:hypothetical protein [Vicinamibacteria bacterium]